MCRQSNYSIAKRYLPTLKPRVWLRWFASSVKMDCERYCGVNATIIMKIDDKNPALRDDTRTHPPRYGFRRVVCEWIEHPSVNLKGCKILKQGKAFGKLAGGCLSLIVSSLATPYALDTKNKILFLEDTNEKVYALDRMLTQLKNAGCLKSVKAILIGTLHSKEADARATLAMLKDVLKDFKGPIVFGFPAGHTDDFISLPLGVEVTLNTQRKKLEFKNPWPK